MSYEAGRWARAHTLVLDRDSTALAVLKELADDFRDIDGCCRIGSYKELALYLGIKKPDTVSAAVARLSALGLVSASNIVVGNCIVGTRFELVGYRKSDWPADRQGQPVWIEFAVSFGMEPQPWWPKLDKNEKADNPQKTEVPRKTDVPQKTGDPRKTELRHPKNGEGVPQKTGDGSPENRGTVPQKTGEGTPKNGSPYTHIRHIRQITNRYELSAPEKNSTGETPCLDTNPNPTSLFAEDEPPLPFEDVPPLDDPEGLFEPEADLPEADPDSPVIATEAQPGPESEESEESEEGKPKAKRKASDRGCVLPFETLPDEWRKDGDELAPELDPDKCWVEFKDFWRGVPGAKGRKAGVDGWHRTWRNYLRKMADWKPKRLLKEKTAQSVLASKKKEYEGWLTRTI